MASRADFRRLAWANVVSHLGDQVTLVALPLTAVLALRAGALELGLLAAAQTVAFLAVGLPAGVWTDRSRRRPILVTADLVRGMALLTVPVAAWRGLLTLPHLYAVALLLGVCKVFFDVAHMSFLPAVVPKEELERGNGVMEAGRSASLLVGPGVGGWLAGVLTAPLALLADAVSFLVTAFLLSGVRAFEPPASGPGGRLRRKVAEGIVFVVREPVLRRVAIGGALTRAGLGFCAVGHPLYLVVELGVGATRYGLLLSAAALGALAGAALAARITARFGPGRTMYGSALLTTALYLPALATGPGWRLFLFPAASALAGVASVVFNVAQISHRQRITPERLLGRVNASMRFLMWGTTPLGGLAAGAVGAWLGGHAVFVTGIAVMALSYLAVVTAPKVFHPV